MPIEGLPPLIANRTSLLAPASEWGARLVSPLGFSLMSKDGMIELAGRVYWIVGLVIAVVLVARKYGYLTGRVTTPDSSSIDIRNGIGEIDTEDSIEDLPRTQGDIVDNQAFVGNLPNQWIEQENDRLRQRMEQFRQQMEQRMDQFRQQMEQMFQQWAQELVQIKRQQRCPTEIEQFR